MKLLEGKTAIVTGASRGIGKGIAIEFAAHGANLALTATKITEAFESFGKELEATGVRVKLYAANVASAVETQQLVDDVVKTFGSIDILINNAGITQDNLLMRMTEAQWDSVMSVNLKSVFNLTKAVQRTMLKQRKGSIINMSSVVGVTGNAGQSNYAASKAGIIAFSKSMAKELGSRNIRSNVIAPGFIMTDMTAELPEEVRTEWTKMIPLKRIGSPKDVADVAVFLASDMSAYVNGQVISVCGGMNT